MSAQSSRWFFLCVSLVVVSAIEARADIAYTTAGSSYTENFDSLATSGAGNAWANDSTLTGWSLFRRTSASDATPAAITAYNAIDGSNNTGSFISFGTGTATERALGGTASGGTYFGSPATGAVAGWIAASITNSTGMTLTDFTLSFNGEQWRDGGANSGTPVAQTMVFEYGLGNTFAGVTTWIAPGGNFNWASPVFTNATSGAAVNGNTAGLVTGRGGTVSGLTWNNGSKLWLRWIENNDAGNDHGLAIDNLSFSAVPEPTAVLFGCLACAGIGMGVCGRRLKVWWKS